MRRFKMPQVRFKDVQHRLCSGDRDTVVVRVGRGHRIQRLREGQHDSVKLVAALRPVHRRGLGVGNDLQHSGIRLGFAEGVANAQAILGTVIVHIDEGHIQHSVRRIGNRGRVTIPLILVGHGPDDLAVKNVTSALGNGKVVTGPEDGDRTIGRPKRRSQIVALDRGLPVGDRQITRSLPGDVQPVGTRRLYLRLDVVTFAGFQHDGSISVEGIVELNIVARALGKVGGNPVSSRIARG